MTNFAFRVPVSHCECGYKLDAATPTDHDSSPSPGAFSVCMRCGRIARFDADLRLKTLTPEQFDELPADFQKELRAIARAARSLTHARR